MGCHFCGVPQSSYIRNVERLLEKSEGELDELGAYLNDLQIFPGFLFGGGRYELARVWSSPQILVEEPEADGDDEGGGGEGADGVSAAGSGAFGGAAEERDEDWTSEEEEAIVDEAGPDQEEATVDTINFVDTVLDVYEESLAALRHRDLEMEAELLKKLTDQPGSATETKTRARRSAMAEYSWKVCEAPQEGPATPFCLISSLRELCGQVLKYCCG